MTEKILENDRVCGIHFKSGKAAYLWDRYNQDWVPSLNMGHDKRQESDETKEQQQQRAQRIIERRKREREQEEQEAVKRKAAKLDEPGEQVQDINMGDEVETSGETAEEEMEVDQNIVNNPSSQTDRKSCSTQTEECDYMFREQKAWLPKKSTIFKEEYSLELPQHFWPRIFNDHCWCGYGYFLKPHNIEILAVFSRRRMSRLTFQKVFCLQTKLSDLKLIGVFTSKIITFHFGNLRRARANKSISIIWRETEKMVACTSYFFSLLCLCGWLSSDGGADFNKGCDCSLALRTSY